MDTTWKSVPQHLTPEMREAGAAAAREYLADTGRNSLDVIWKAMLAAAPTQPVTHEIEIITSDRNNTYRASPRVCHATEAAGLQGKSATYTGGRVGAVQRLLEKSTRPLNVESALIVLMLPESSDPHDRMRYSVLVQERSA